jgi:hypothetical protein
MHEHAIFILNVCHKIHGMKIGNKEVAERD